MEKLAHSRRTLGARLRTRFPRKPFVLLIAMLSIAGLTAAWAAGLSAESVRSALFSEGGGQMRVDLDQGKTEAIEPAPSMAVGALETPRSRHSATVLADGRVLIAGGDAAGSSEVYDPVTGVSAPSGYMGAARSGHTATRLADGRVLIAGGSVGGSAVASTEIFDPATGTFSTGSPMTTARSGHTATALANGDVLIAGGGSDSAETFNGTSFTAVSGTMTASRTNASAIRMNDGRIFIAGGDGLQSAEIYDPADGTFTAGGNAMTLARSRALLRLLPDGKIQIIGGNSDGSMEIYDPAIDTIGAYAHVVPATDPCANLINYVLAAETRAALIFNGSAAPERDRSGHTITELGSKAIVVGGNDGGGNATGTITIFDSSTATVTTDELDYSPGSTVTVTGTGFEPGETVAVKIHEDPHTEFERGLIEGNPVADESGNFSGTYVVQDVDLDMHFVVGARGQTSGRTAQTTFTDANNDADVAPAYVGGAGTTTFSTVYEVTVGTPSRLVRNVRVRLPAGYTPVSVVGVAFSSGTWNAPTISGQDVQVTTTSNAGGNSLDTGGWARIDIVANTPVSSTTDWEFQTSTSNTNINTQSATDDTVVLVGPPNAATAAATFVNGVGATISPTLTPGVSSTLNYRLTQTGGGNNDIKYTSLAVPMCFTTPTSVTVVVRNSSGVSVGTGGYSVNILDGFIRLSGGNVPLNGSLTVTFTTTPNCTAGSFAFPSSPSSNAANPASGTNQVVAVTPGGGLAVAVNKANTATTITSDSPDPSVVGQSVPINFTVTETDISPATPAGNVTVNASTGESCVGTVATPTCSITFNTAGPRTLTATYAGDSNFNGSTSSPATPHQVNKADTTTTITSDHLNPLAWSQIFPTGTGPSATTCAQTSHPDGEGRLVVYARTVCGGGIGQVWVLNNANGVGSPAWSLVASGGPARHGQTTVYDEIGNNLILFGGCSGGCLPVNNDVWVLSNANGQGGPAVWTQITGIAGGPPAARNHAAGAYDPATNRLMIYGGQNGGGVVVGATFSDVWVLTNANTAAGAHSWSSLATSGTFPKGVYQPRAFYDSANNRLTVAGGARSDTGTASSAVNVLTNANGIGGAPAWTTLIAEGAPGAPAFAGWHTTQDASVNRGILAQQSSSNLYYLNNVNGLGGPTSYSLVSPTGGGGAVPGYGLGFDAPTARTMAWHQSGGTNLSYYLTPASSSVFGESVTFTATVTVNAPGSGTPGGTVQFFVNGVTPIGGPQPVVSGSASVVTSTLVVGTHNITAVYSGNTDFNGSSSGILPHTVTKAATSTTVLSSPNPSTYGDSVTFTSTTLSGGNPVGEGTVSFYDGGTRAAPGTLLAASATVASLTGEAGFSISTLNAGSHTVIACYAGTNYSDSNGSVVHVVDQRSLTVTADDQTITYGDPDPGFTFQYGAEFVLGDDAGDIDIAPTCSVSGPHTNVGNYPIVCSGGSDNNYQFSFVNGTLEVEAATLNVNAVANTKVYGDADPAFAFALTGFKFGENAISAAVTGAASCTRTIGETVAGSPYTITCAPGSLAAANYVFTTGTTANFTITAATLNVNAVVNTKVYGDSDPAFAYTLSGFKFLEDATSAGVTGAASCTRVAGESVAGGPYAITCAPGTLAAANYVFATGTTANFTITAATLNVNAVANTKIYGDGDPAFAYAFSGFKFSEDATTAGVTGAASCTRTLGESVAGSPYTITCGAGTLAAANYIFATGTTANFTITPATLNVNAVANTKIYGDGDPAFAYALVGFKFAEDATSAGVTGAASCTRTAGETVAGSPYTITCAPGSLAAANYVFATGTTADFTITPATLNVNAVANTKEYGDLDPAFSYTLTGFKFIEDATTAGVTGLASCTRAPGETVAGSPYAITCTAGSLTAANYVFATGTTANFTITAATLDVDAVDDSKIYGDPDPPFGYTLSGFKLSEDATSAGVTGAASCTRTAGESVAGSPYIITCAPGTLTAANYVFATGTTANFNISPATLNVNAIADSKTYGDADPAFQYALSGFKFSENPVTALVTGLASCSRTLGESVAGSPYIITCAAGTLAAPNYVFVAGTTANFVIDQRPATWTTNPNSKTYGDPDPVPLTTGSGSNFVDSVTATYARVAGENASPPTYHITATLNAAPGVLANYIITNDGAEFTINKRLATWTTNPNSKTYGDPDPIPLTTGSGSNFVAADNVTATYARVSGENASPPTYHLTATLSATPLSALDNYIITNDGAEFTINKRLATWTTNPASKTYGDPDPVPLTTGSGSNFVAADNVTATYARVAGENASPPTYHITATLSATPLSALDNYIITNDGAEFTINKRLATWTTNPNSKTYGDVDPSPLTTGSGSNFVAADNVTATYTRVAGENASPPTYHITATLSTTGDLNNYIITNDGAEFTINKRLATWTTNPASKTYGDPDPVPLTTGSGSNFVAADNVTATYSRVAGENASPPTYLITATLSATGDLNNYIITNDGAEFTINKRLATWTTNPNSKTYGDVDPSPLTTGSGSNFVAADNVTATYSRVAGENASPPTYHLTATLSATPLSALDNYIITNDGDEFTINKRLATWTTDPNSKTYGDADPVPLTTGSGSNFVAADNVTATYARVAGENASPPTYHIAATLSATPLSALDNYVITNDGAEFTINKRLATWTTNPNSKTYGDVDPSPLTTGSGINFVAADNVTATYARVAGENASPPTYHITATLSATPLSALDNYVITNDGDEFTINKRLATWTTNPNSKTYGDVDPSPLTTGSGTNFVAADNVTATYARVSGENASPATYHITATLSATGDLNNYIITNDGAEFTINKRLATWTTNPNSKTYGDADPAGLTTGSGSNFLAADNVTATYSRVAGENASPPTYHITATLSATGDLNNYVITNDGAEFTINKRLATWTTNPNSKTYGDVDPSPLTTGSGTNFVAADNVTAAYTRVAGENASPPTYHITATLSATPLSALDNYDITNDGAEFTINKRLATWTTDSNSKTYGDADPAGLTTGSGSNFVAADNVTAAYTRLAGESASPPTYHITATLSATPPSALDNYVITNDGAEFTITKRLATWTTNPASKTYGDPDSAPLTTGSGSNFVAADNVTATYSRVAGENASPPTYHITATLSATGDLNNYVITNDGAEFTINKRPITVTADPKTKVYGNADPALTYQITSGTLAFSDSFSGALSRAAGENVGTYAINQGTLTLGGNYDLSYVPANFTITARPITVTADAKTKVFSTPDPPLTYQITSGSLAFTDPFIGALTRAPGELVGSYAINRGTLNINDGNGGNNYTFTYVGSYLTILTGCSVFDGFRPPIGGAVELGTGGTFANPVRTFKLGSTIPVKWGATCFNTALVTGIHTLQAIKYSDAATVVGDPIDATPTDAATTGNQFRLTGTEWHYNLDTKRTPGISQGTWLLRATLYDGSMYTVWISIKK